MIWLILLPTCLAFAVFTFYRLEISFGMFLALMPIVPHDHWNNLYIFLALVFYWGMFFLQYLSGKRDGIRLREIKPALIVYVIFLLISLITGQGGVDSVRVLVILLSCIMFSVFFQNIITSRQTLNMLQMFLFIGMAITAVYALVQYRQGIEVRADQVDLLSSQGLKRAFSTMNNPNNYSEYLIMLIPICSAHMLNCKTDAKRLFVFLLLLPCIPALVLTYSRASYLALVAGMAVYVLLAYPRFVPYGIFLFLVCIPFLPSSVIQRILTIGSDTSSKFRLLIWEGTLKALRDFWIQGIGLGPDAFARIYKLYSPPTATAAMHSHNLLLQVLIESGIGGFIAFITLIFTTVKDNLLGISKNPANRNMLAAYTGAITAITLFGMADYVWYYPRVMLVFWLLIGMSLGSARLFNNEGVTP